jgi:S-adenosylmethionine hydrolase
MAILTLTSDFGQQDYLAGAVKGRILRVSEAFRIVDISHSVAPFQARHAAYVCRNAFPHFPEGSLHMVLVNLFDARHAHFLLARKDGCHIAVADNGLLALMYDDGPDEVVSVNLDAARKRDVLHFCDAMALALRRVMEGEPLAAIGEAGVEVRGKAQSYTRAEAGWMEGRVIHIDPFENVVVDITREAFEAHRRGRPFQIAIVGNDSIDRISESYSDVPEGEKLAMFNAAGYLEIAVNKGKACGLLGLQTHPGEGVSYKKVRPLQTTHFYHTVRIHFG